MADSGFWTKLKSIKHIELYACGAVLAAVLAIYFSCISCSAQQTNTSADVNSSDYCTAMRAQVESVVSEIAGVGNASVVINWDRSVSAFGGTNENPKATGALIVCDGGAGTKVKLDVILAVSTLLDLDTERIVVYPKSN